MAVSATLSITGLDVGQGLPFASQAVRTDWARECPDEQVARTGPASRMIVIAAAAAASWGALGGIAIALARVISSI